MYRWVGLMEVLHVLAYPRAVVPARKQNSQRRRGAVWARRVRLERSAGRGWRLAQLWNPLDRRLIPRGIRLQRRTCDNDRDAHTPETMADELRAAAALVFDK